MRWLIYNHRNPSRHRIEEHDMQNWVEANRKKMNAGELKPERKELSEDESLDELMERTLNNSAVAGDVDWGRDLAAAKERLHIVDKN